MNVQFQPNFRTAERRLPFARRHETAALREFELTYVGSGSKSVLR